MNIVCTAQFFFRLPEILHFTAVSDKPEGPFEPKDCVLKTDESMPVNGIDANIIRDVKTGEMYMVYGSFWGGIHILKLNEQTGLAAEDGIGTCICCRPAWLSGAVEGPYIIYNEETEYYYLFVSYGSLKTDYQIRVGRSKKGNRSLCGLQRKRNDGYGGSI